MVDTESEGFRALLRRAQAGDREALERILSILRPHLEPIARRYANPVRPTQSTADLVQETCLRAWQKLGNFEIGDTDQQTFAMFRSWMAQIVRHLGVDAQRASGRQRRRPPGKVLSVGAPGARDSTSVGGSIEPPSPSRTPSAYLRGEELDREVRAALEGIPDPRDAAIVRMHVFEGLSFAQISERLHLGYQTVRGHYYSTLERLKREFRDWL